MKSKIILLVLFAFVFVQGSIAQITITGTVTGAEDGAPIPGVNVIVKGYSESRIITDLYGNYTLSVPSYATTLIFSFVSMETVEVQIGGQNVINVVLENADVGIEEVVVIRIAEQKKKLVSICFPDIYSENLDKQPEIEFINGKPGKVSLERKPLLTWH